MNTALACAIIGMTLGVVAMLRGFKHRNWSYFFMALAFVLAEANVYNKETKYIQLQAECDYATRPVE